jgi:hypothetical protein
MSAIDISIWNNWVNSLSDKDRQSLNYLIHTRRINVSHNEIQANVPRKLVKIVGRSQNIQENP